MYSLAGLFWRNDLGCASVIPSEQTASSYIILYLVCRLHVYNRKPTNRGLWGDAVADHAPVTFSLLMSRNQICGGGWLVDTRRRPGRGVIPGLVHYFRLCGLTFLFFIFFCNFITSRTRSWSSSRRPGRGVIPGLVHYFRLCGLTFLLGLTKKIPCFRSPDRVTFPQNREFFFWKCTHACTMCMLIFARIWAFLHVVNQTSPGEADSSLHEVFVNLTLRCQEHVEFAYYCMLVWGRW